MSYFLKSIFLLFYDVANLSNSLFIFPILIEYFLQFNIKINWINIGLIYTFYHMGILLGNLLWKKLIYKFSSAVLLLMSLILIIILNIILIYIKNFEILLFQRFFLGLLNNLSFIQKNIFLELNKNKNELFIINIFSYIISIFINVFNFNKTFNLNFNNNKFVLNIIFLLLINIILLFLTLLLIKNKNIKIFSKKSYESNSPKINKKKIFSDEKIVIKSIKKDKNNKNVFNLVEETDLSIEKSNRNFNNNNSINNKNETFNNMKFSNNNLNEEIEYEKNNKNFIKNIFKINKEKKLSFIHSLLNLLDYVYFIWIFIILYFECFNNSLKIGMNFLCLNLIFLCLNFPLTNKIFSILKKNNNKKNINKLSNIIFILEIIVIIIISLDVIIYFFNIIENEKIKIIFFYVLFIFRNLINSGLIQIYNIYIAMEFNYQTKNIRILNEFNKKINCILKTIFSFFCAYAFFLFENTNNIDFNVNNLIVKFVLFFCIFPLIILITSLILVNNYLI